MVTLAQAQERAERWVNGDVPDYMHQVVRVREFDLGFVAWTEPRENGPTLEGSRARLVIARDSGDSTLWPGLPVDEVIRRYMEEHSTAEAPAAEKEPPKRVDLEATSFLLTPPEWLQQAADEMGVPDSRPSASTPAPDPAPAATPSASASGPSELSALSEAPEPSGEDAGASAAAAHAPGGSNPWEAADTSGSGAAPGRPRATVFAPPISGSDEDDAPPPSTRPDAKTELLPEGSALPRTALSPALDPTSKPGDGPSGAEGAEAGAGDGPDSDPERSGAGGAVHQAATMLADPSSGSGISGPPPPPGAPGTPGASSGGSGGSRGGGFSVPPPGAPGTPGARPGGSDASGSGSSGSGYVPTQLVSADDVAASGQQPAAADPSGSGDGSGEQSGASEPSGAGAPGANDTGSGAVHQAATMLADPSSGGAAGPGEGAAPAAPGAPAAPPPAPNAPAGGAAGGPGGVHQAATMLADPAAAGPAGPPGAPGGPPPGPPGAPGVPGPAGHPGAPVPGAPGVPGAPAGQPPGAPMPGGQPPAYGYPQGGQPLVGPGYMAVLRYRAADGSEQQVIRRSAPGTPHPEWQILYELRGMNIPPQQVLELHTELESCDLPGGYCTKMIRETWPQVRVSHTAPYGRDHATRQQGMRHLVEHQGELHQVADGPARPGPNRVPLPPPQQIQPMPPIPPDGIGHELVQALGPQGVFRFDQRAVSRQGVPDVVAQTLVWAGVPVDMNPFFWGQVQPGQPVPTLAELAQERGVQPAPDAASYLVMGNDFGRQICVQYGTAHIVAVPLEGPQPGTPPIPPQFVNTGLPEFVRCLGLLARMWPLRFGLNQEQAGRWTVDFQMQLAALDPAALGSPENWWSVLLEQMWDGLF